MMTLEELQAYLKLSEACLRKWITEKRIPAHKVGGVWRFYKEEIDQWVRGGGSL